MRLFRFFLGVVIIAGVVLMLFQPAILSWLIHHPYVDGILALLGIAFHWFNTYYPTGIPPSMRG